MSQESVKLFALHTTYLEAEGDCILLKRNATSSTAGVYPLLTMNHRR